MIKLTKETETNGAKVTITLEVGEGKVENETLGFIMNKIGFSNDKQEEKPKTENKGY